MNVYDEAGDIDPYRQAETTTKKVKWIVLGICLMAISAKYIYAWGKRDADRWYYNHGFTSKGNCYDVQGGRAFPGHVGADGSIACYAADEH